MHNRKTPLVQNTYKWTHFNIFKFHSINMSLHLFPVRRVEGQWNGNNQSQQQITSQLNQGYLWCVETSNMTGHFNPIKISLSGRMENGITHGFKGFLVNPQYSDISLGVVCSKSWMDRRTEKRTEDNRKERNRPSPPGPSVHVCLFACVLRPIYSQGHIEPINDRQWRSGCVPMVTRGSAA